MKVSITITEHQIKRLIVAYLSEKLNGHLDEKSIIIQVKSKQNYKSEWEQAYFRATYEGEI